MPSLTFRSYNQTTTDPRVKDTFENIREPWTWPNSTTIPGGVLMSLCAAAAYHTIPTDFILDNLQAHFLGGPKTTIPMKLKVTRLSNGRRFVVRFVSLEQNGFILLTATVTFVNASPWTGPAMTHAVKRLTNYKVDCITMDDLGEARGRLGSFMKFERMPLVFQGGYW